MIYASKVRINKQGYDSRGMYFGVADESVYFVTDKTNMFSAYIRATSVKEARGKAASLFKGYVFWCGEVT